MCPLYVTSCLTVVRQPNFPVAQQFLSYFVRPIKLVFGTKWKLWFPNPGKPKENNFETYVFYMYKFLTGFPCATMEIPPFLRAVEMITSRFRSLHERGNPFEVSKVSVFYFSRFKIFVVFHFRKAQLFPCGFL